MRGIVTLCGLLLSIAVPAESASPADLVGRDRPNTDGYNSCLTAEMMNWSRSGDTAETIVSCLNKPNGDYLFYLSVGITEDTMWGWIKYSEIGGFHEMVMDVDCAPQRGGRFETEVSSPARMTTPPCWIREAAKYRSEVDVVIRDRGKIYKPK